MPVEHIVQRHAGLVEVYTLAAEAGIATAHIAEFYLERWWEAFVASHRLVLTECVV